MTTLIISLMGLSMATASRRSRSPRTYSCVVGQGESGASESRFNLNDRDLCANKCTETAYCVGFDFTTRRQADACRLYSKTDGSRNHGGRHNRKWCVVAAFEVDCDHLEVDGNCVRTKTYGNDHECRVTAKKTVQLAFSYFDVETMPNSNCPYDYLQIGGRKYCGDIDSSSSQTNTPPRRGLVVHEGGEIRWSTDYSITEHGWEICAEELGGTPEGFDLVGDGFCRTFSGGNPFDWTDRCVDNLQECASWCVEQGAECKGISFGNTPQDYLGCAAQGTTRCLTSRHTNEEVGNSRAWTTGVTCFARDPWIRAESSQCHVSAKQYPEDRLDNPIFNTGGFIGTMTRTECMAECDTRTDPRRRPCVAIEMSTHSDNPNTIASCALAWGCDSGAHWSRGDVFIRPSAPGFDGARRRFDAGSDSLPAPGREI